MLNSPQFFWVAYDKIKPGQHQPRLLFDEAQLKELAASIAQHGILQPLLLNQDYHIIAGERRYRAAGMLGLIELPCMILRVEASSQALMALLENVQRAQMEPLEQALAYQRLADDFSWTQQDIADLLGKSRVHVTNMLRLLRLGPEVLSALKNKDITYGHARVLVGLSSDQQLHYLKWLQKYKASVRQLEKKVQQEKKQQSCASGDDNQWLFRQLSEQVGAPVEMEQDSKGGTWLKFKFFDDETFLGLLQSLGLRYDI